MPISDSSNPDSPKKTHGNTSIFSTAAQWTSRQCGRPSTFIIACSVIVVWGVTGPVFDYSDTWQLIINTGTTIVTFLMVFLIQNTQNRDMASLQLKLDELIRVNANARNRLLGLENSTEEEIERLKGTFAHLAGPEDASSETGDPTSDLDQAGQAAKPENRAPI
jgi:low affinity Fe/Cu permease